MLKDFESNPPILKTVLINPAVSTLVNLTHSSHTDKKLFPQMWHLPLLCRAGNSISNFSRVSFFRDQFMTIRAAISPSASGWSSLIAPTGTSSTSGFISHNNLHSGRSDGKTVISLSAVTVENIYFNEKSAPKNISDNIGCSRRHYFVFSHDFKNEKSTRFILNLNRCSDSASDGEHMTETLF